jgi:hypothetical protein
MLLHLRADVHPSTSWLPAALILRLQRQRPRAPQALLVDDIERADLDEPLRATCTRPTRIARPKSPAARMGSISASTRRCSQ